MSKVEIGMVSKSQPVSQGTRKPYRFKVCVSQIMNETIKVLKKKTKLQRTSMNNLI